MRLIQLHLGLRIGAGLVLLTMLVGCSFFGSGNKQPGFEQLRLEMELEKEVFNRHEALLITVRLTNLSDEPAILPNLDHQTVEFMRADAMEVVEEGKDLETLMDSRKNAVRIMEPVFSPQENTGQPGQLPPGKTLKRRFLFTQATFDAGEYRMLADYKRPHPEQPNVPEHIISKPVRFQVREGEPWPERYLNGLIKKEVALQLAKDSVPGSNKRATAKLIKDEKGFNKWWVNVRYESAGEGEAVRAFFIDPYQGRVWREAKPFEKDEKSYEPPYPKDAPIMRNKYREQLATPEEKGAGNPTLQTQPAPRP